MTALRTALHRPPQQRRPPALRAVPAVGCALALLTTAAGLLIHATGSVLGTALPPFVLVWTPEADPLLVVTVLVLAAAAYAVPRVIEAKVAPAPTAVALYALALALGLALNVARAGPHGWWSMFDSRHGSYEWNFEYLPGLPALRFGVHYYVQHFAYLATYLPTHAKGNPPGPLVALHLLGITTGQGLAALCIGVGALCAPLAYDLGRTLGGEQRGRLAGVLTAFTPSVMLFGVTSVDYAFAAMGMGVTCLLARRGRVALVAGGLLAGVASFFSWLLLAIPALATLVALRRHGPRRAAAVASAGALGIVAVDIALWLVWGYDPFSALRATSHFYHLGIARTRPYAFWLFGSPTAWAVMLGAPVLWFLLRALTDGDSVAFALIAVIALASLLGLTKAETERIWLPFVPLACVAAAAALPRRRLGAALWLLVAQALAVELLFFTIW